MLYLLLAIFSSMFVTVFLRITESRVKSDMTMFAGNYAVCSLLSLAYAGKIPFADKGFSAAVILGCISGVFFLAGFLMLKKSLVLNGVAITSTFMKIGVLVPTLIAVLFFKERMTGFKLAGFLIALAAIVMLKFEREGQENPKHFGMLLFLLFCGGMADAFSTIYEHLGTDESSDAFLLFTFLSAFLLSMLLALREIKKAAWTDLLCGALVALPNYYSSRFLLLALSSGVPAVTVYPVYSVSVLVLITLAGVIFFKERLSGRKWAAIGMILAALLLLNLGQ